MTPVRLEPAATLSRVKHSTTEPPYKSRRVNCQSKCAKRVFKIGLNMSDCLIAKCSFFLVVACCMYRKPEFENCESLQVKTLKGLKN